MKSPRDPQPRKPSVPLSERWKQVQAWAQRVAVRTEKFLRRVLPQKNDDEKTRLFKSIAWSLIGMAFLVCFMAVSVFFLALRGQEQTMVPQLQGKELADAIVELQEKALVPFVQLRFSDDPQDKGRVVGQDPQGGLVSKAGRRVTLWVSKGAIINNVENYVGQPLGDVQLRLKTLFSTQTTPLLTLAPNPVYAFDSAPEGTVIDQKPMAGTPLAGPTQLVVVVSKGPRGQMTKVGNYTDRPWPEAMALLIGENRPFVITVRKPQKDERPGSIVDQDPKSGSQVPKGTEIHLTMTQPVGPNDGRVFELLSTTLPQYPIMVDVKIGLHRASNGDDTTLYQFKHPGGLLTVPFTAEPGDLVSVSVLDNVVYQKKVGEP